MDRWRGQTCAATARVERDAFLRRDAARLHHRVLNADRALVDGLDGVKVQAARAGGLRQRRAWRCCRRLAGGGRRKLRRSMSGGHGRLLMVRRRRLSLVRRLRRSRGGGLGSFSSQRSLLRAEVDLPRAASMAEMSDVPDMLAATDGDQRSGDGATQASGGYWSATGRKADDGKLDRRPTNAAEEDRATARTERSEKRGRVKESRAGERERTRRRPGGSAKGRASRSGTSTCHLHCDFSRHVLGVALNGAPVPLLLTLCAGRGKARLEKRQETHKNQAA